MANRSWTVADILTHPGDSYEVSQSAPVLDLRLITPWGSTTASVEFAQRLGVRYVVPIHDLYLTGAGSELAANLVTSPLEDAGIELVPLDLGEGFLL